MSIFWYVDEGSRPARFEARLTLIVLERTPVPIPELWPTIDAQLRWWNQRVEHTAVYDREAQVRFNLRARHATPQEERASGVHEAMAGVHGAMALQDWVRRHQRYPGGLGVILVGSAGGGWGASEAQQSIVHYTISDTAADRRGPAVSLVLAHELGHLLGMSDRYDRYEVRTEVPRSGPRYPTQSHDGWEGNLMADVHRDRLARPRRIWLSRLQTMPMVEAASRAAGPERRGQCGDADYFAERVGPKWHRR